MKPVGLAGTGLLLLLLGTTVPAFAQQEQHEQEGKSEKQGQAKPERQQQQAKPAGQEQQAKPEQRQEQAKSTKLQTQPAKQEERGNVAGRQPAQRSSAEEQRQRSEPALRLSSRSNFRIPHARFHSSFGHEHRFHIGKEIRVGSRKGDDHALDNFRDLAGAVALGIGDFLHPRRVHPHSVGDGHRRARDQARSRPKSCLVEVT